MQKRHTGSDGLAGGVELSHIVGCLKVKLKRGGGREERKREEWREGGRERGREGRRDGGREEQERKE